MKEVVNEEQGGWKGIFLVLALLASGGVGYWIWSQEGPAPTEGDGTAKVVLPDEVPSPEVEAPAPEAGNTNALPQPREFIARPATPPLNTPSGKPVGGSDEVLAFWSQTPRELPVEYAPHYWQTHASGWNPDLIEQVIQLGSDDFGKRRDAEKALRGMGEAARLALREAAGSQNDHRRDAGRRLLRELKYLPVGEALRQQAFTGFKVYQPDRPGDPVDVAPASAVELFHLRTGVNRSTLLRHLEALGAEGLRTSRWLSVIPDPFSQNTRVFFAAPYKIDRLLVQPDSFAFLVAYRAFLEEMGPLRFSAAEQDRTVYRKAVAEFEAEWQEKRAEALKPIEAQIAYLERASTAEYAPTKWHAQAWLFLTGVRGVDHLWEMYRSDHPVPRQFAAAQLVRLRPEEFLNTCTVAEADRAAQLRAVLGLQIYSNVAENLRDNHPDLREQVAPHRDLLLPLLDAKHAVLRTAAVCGLVPHRMAYERNGQRRLSANPVSLVANSWRSDVERILAGLQADTYEIRKGSQSGVEHFIAGARESRRDEWIRIFSVAKALNETAGFSEIREQLAAAGLVPPHRDEGYRTVHAYAFPYAVLLESMRKQAERRAAGAPDVLDTLEQQELLYHLQYARPLHWMYSYTGESFKVIPTLAALAREHQDVRERLIAITEDSARLNRSRALLALAQAGDLRGTPELQEIIRSPDARFFWATSAALALARYGGSEHAPVIESLFDRVGFDENAERYRIVYARCQFRDAKSEALVDRLLHKNECKRCPGPRHNPYCERTSNLALYFAIKWELNIRPEEVAHKFLHDRMILGRFLHGDDSALAESFRMRNKLRFNLPAGPERTVDFTPALIARVNEVCGTSFRPRSYEEQNTTGAYREMNEWWQANKDQYLPAEARP